MRKIGYDLFKFRAVNENLFSALVNCSLWFSSPDSLNDPFDCQIDLRASWQRAAVPAPADIRSSEFHMIFDDSNGLLENLERGLKGAGVCSFTMDMNNPLMWAHYGDDYKGVCLLYKFYEDFLNDSENFVCIDRVDYSDDKVTEWLVRNVERSSLNVYDRLMLRDSRSGQDFVNDFILTYLNSKSPAWSHEQEVRIIRQRPGAFKVPYGSLTQVCFGLRTPKEHIELVMELAKRYCGCNVFCQLVKDENSDYGIKVEQLS